MKRKIKRLSLLLICSIMVVMAIVIIAKPAYRFTAKQYFLSFGNHVDLEELDKNNFDYETVDVKDIGKKDYIIDQSMMLVNTSNPLNNDFKPEIKEYKQTGVKMNKCVISAYNKLSNDITNNTNEKLYVMSSYRTAAEQKEIEKEQGDDTAMPAGSSEHQTGLGLDVYFDKHAGSAIITCEAGRYLNENCWKSGFIIRYPAGKKSSTGIDYEPWHIRYVGSPHSEIIMKNHLSLEEYYNSLEIGKFYKYNDYIISRQNTNKLIISDGIKTVVSSDNEGGYIITVKVG